ncbi:acyltransferase [Grimontia sp. NTOU-MAR1]|uniref:acyltransferase n=1 Tax=Grimontia sp. NTOU-MAR1 TaxID=3111011 RepID=UPI002DB587B5|nr:acyltransferase [Grimontia sp. NTOU-MAR1]WRV97508.1 acyltransferase [Grimontia sp. NTOU-MAR1]
MAYYTEEELNSLGFKSLGINVKVSKLASIYNHDSIELGDHSRIDDFCVISGKVSIGKYCHITPMCLIAGGTPGVFLDDFVTLAYGVKIFSQSDDYSGKTMTNSLVPREFKDEIFEPVTLEKYVIVGANATILPGTVVAEGGSIGSMTLVNKNTQPWSMYVGVPARYLKERKRDLLKLVPKFLSKIEND